MWDQPCWIERISFKLFTEQVPGALWTRLNLFHISVLGTIMSHCPNCVLRCWSSLQAGLALMHETEGVEVRMGFLIIGMLVNKIVANGTNMLFWAKIHSALESRVRDHWDLCLCNQSLFKFDQILLWRWLLEDWAESITRFPTVDILKTRR